MFLPSSPPDPGFNAHALCSFEADRPGISEVAARWQDIEFLIQQGFFYGEGCYTATATHCTMSHSFSATRTHMTMSEATRTLRNVDSKMTADQDQMIPMTL